MNRTTDPMEQVVYHVSDNGDPDKSGVYRPRAFRRRYPYVHKLFTEQGAEYVNFESGDGKVIVTEEPRGKFREDVIIQS